MLKEWNKVLLALLIGMLLTGNVQASETNLNENNNLSAALQDTVMRHPSVKSKLAELTSLGFTREATEASRLPSITMQTQSSGLSNGNSQGLLRVQQTLWSFGKNEGTINVAKRKIDAGMITLLEVRRQLMEDTAATYANLWGAKKRLAIAETNVAEHDRLYQMILRRQEGSIASESDVRLARSRFIQAQGQRDLLQGTVEKTRQDLAALTQSSNTADEPVDSVLIPELSLDTIMEIAKTREAKVQRQLAEIEIVRAEVALSKANLMPTLTARYDHDIAPPSNIVSTYSPNRMGIALEGSMDGMGIAGKKRVDAEKARLLAAQENVEDARNEARRHLIGLITERDTQQRMIMSYEQSVAEMDETLKSCLRQYDAGRKSWLDVLNFQRELSDARQQLEQSRTSCQEMSLRLAAITGQFDRLAGVKP